jgi:hypothetical protein
MALYFSPDSGRGESLSREALELARRTGNAATVARSLIALHFALWRPDRLEERRLVAAQVIELAEQAREPEMALEGRLWLLVDEIERGDGHAAAREQDAVARAASALRHPLYRWHAELQRAMRALADGRADEAERISGAALEFGERAGLLNPRQAFGVQAFWIRREQGRLAELEEHLRAVAEKFRIPIWRCGLALLHAETGRASEARRELASLVDDDFAALPIDGNWLCGMAVLALVCAEVGDRDQGRQVYDRLLPYADRVVVVAQAHVCVGPVAYFLGRLAALDERWDDALSHLEAAVRVAEGLDAARLVTNARCALAAVLQDRAPGPVRTEAVSSSREVRSTPAPRPAIFRKDGQYWTLAFDGTEARLRHSRGLSYLAELLGHPDREIHTLDLAVRFRAEPADGAEASGGDAGPLLDEAAKAAYRERAEEVRAELEEATALNDLGRAERARAELELLTHELAAAVGLGRRDRKSHSNAERSRVAVTKAVGVALKSIAETNPALRRYLAGTVRTGQFCSYTPDPRFPVAWTLS